jgi:hypothetical protein
MDCHCSATLASGDIQQLLTILGFPIAVVGRERFRRIDALIYVHADPPSEISHVMPPTLLDVYNPSVEADTYWFPAGPVFRVSMWLRIKFRTRKKLTVRIVMVELLYRTGTGASHFELSHGRVGVAIMQPFFLRP